MSSESALQQECFKKTFSSTPFLILGSFNLSKSAEGIERTSRTSLMSLQAGCEGIPLLILWPFFIIHRIRAFLSFLPFLHLQWKW
ncbi:hypothetical protein CEXT_553641 [Caerostris extrusa]|uniref:Uncharacterized protein n=1 Tax=Caerostris extrusa TaxID=172846 RepID=A0AAV4PYF4_CAEEX|nr:hypothetical protein CEXT_553641 [Caerostris extrusa]